MWCQLVLLCCVCVCVCVCVRRGPAAAEPPALAGRWPLLGHAHMLMGDGVKLFRSLVRMSEECVDKGGLVTFHLGFNKIYGITDPDDCLTVMNTCLDKSLFMKFGKQFLGDGLLTADVKRWQTSRKLLSPAFNQKLLDGFMEIFNSQARDLVKKFASEIGKPFDHDKIIREKSLETICAASFDVHDSDYSDILKQYLPLFLTAAKKISKRLQNFWLHSDFIYNITGEKKEVDDIIKKLVALSKMMVQKKKLEKQKQKLLNNKMDTGAPKKFIDLILELAEETGSFTEEQVREEADTIVLGGHDSDASTLTLALALLGSHARRQDRVHREIIEVCGNSDESIAKEHLSKLVYTEAVLKETLRLYPVGLILPRRVDREIKLKNYTIKANSDCLIMSHGLHRESIWGPDADQFRPERWLDKDTLPDPKYYAGFGLGKRSCIGKAYAMMSMKTALAHVVRGYRVSADVSQLVVAYHLLSRPHSGYFITLEKR